MGNSNKDELQSFLNFKAEQYESFSFIETDPILIPHRFNDSKDVEIMAFLMATIAWGNRNSIIKSGERLIELFDNSPYEFIMNANEAEINISLFLPRPASSSISRSIISAKLSSDRIIPVP